jgi:hypothetical protein
MPRRPDLEYLKAVNQAAPPADPQLLFLLMGQYANANLEAEGIEFLSAFASALLGGAGLGWPFRLHKCPGRGATPRSAHGAHRRYRRRSL